MVTGNPGPGWARPDWTGYAGSDPYAGNPYAATATVTDVPGVDDGLAGDEWDLSNFAQQVEANPTWTPPASATARRRRAARRAGPVTAAVAVLALTGAAVWTGMHAHTGRPPSVASPQPQTATVRLTSTATATATATRTVTARPTRARSTAASRSTPAAARTTVAPANPPASTSQPPAATRATMTTAAVPAPVTGYLSLARASFTPISTTGCPHCVSVTAQVTTNLSPVSVVAHVGGSHALGGGPAGFAATFPVAAGSYTVSLTVVAGGRTLTSSSSTLTVH